MSEDNTKKDYASTVLVPKTEFSQQAKLATSEVDTLEKWEKKGLYKKILNKNKGKKKFILHDGPPYANGDIHIGHALNKILKDVIVRYKTMQGFQSPYIPGWDCHGLPIELKVTTNLGSKAKTMSKVEIRQHCKEYAYKYVNTQREQFKRLLISGDWDNPYLTLDPKFELGILKALKTLVENDYVYKGKKPVYWCAHCVTALAEAEVEYENHKSPSIFVKFPISNPQDNKLTKELKSPTIVIWTTTPWTLPANLAVALDPDYDYVGVEANGETYIVAQYLKQGFLEANKIPTDAPVVAAFKGKHIEGLKVKHPLLEKESSIIIGDFITLEQGTGCVHIAPGHGMDDYLVCLKYGIQPFVPVDDYGKFTADYPQMAGENIWKANPKIIEVLKEKNLLLSSSEITHSYPHCWRCHKPVVFRATEQWFMSVERNNLRQHMLDFIDNNIEWIPRWGRDRIYNMMLQRPDWCLSRQRSWGVPIPAVVCEKCGVSFLKPIIIENFMKYVKDESTDAWFSHPVKDFLPPGFKCEKCGSTEFKAEQNILDVWFDSGSSHIAVLENNPDLAWPCDLYLEGSDQHRGWFQTSLIVAAGTKSSPPYKQVLTHGFVLDEKGEAMSKSKGNVVSPLEVIKKLGAGVLRLWVISEDYRNDLKVSEEILKRNSEAYRKIRNTLRFLLANVQDFNPETDTVQYKEMDEIDQYSLHILNDLIAKITNAFETIELHKIYHSVHNFCVINMSSFYLDVIKDRLYCSGLNDKTRRSAQTVVYQIASALSRMLAPVLPHTTEEFWTFFKPGSESIHLEEFPQPVPEWNRPDLAETWGTILKIRDEALSSLEEKRREKTIGHSLDAEITLATGNKDIYSILKKYEKQWETILIVSYVNIKKDETSDKSATTDDCDITVDVKAVEWEKCPRCWKHKKEVKGEETPLCERCSDVVRRTENG